MNHIRELYPENKIVIKFDEENKIIELNDEFIKEHKKQKFEDEDLIVKLLKELKYPKKKYRNWEGIFNRKTKNF